MPSEAYEKIYNYTLEQIEYGASKENIINKLTEAGVYEEDAQIIYERAKADLESTKAQKRELYKKQGQKRLAWGTAGLLLGFILTFAGAASSGNRYIVFVGLIAVGGVYALVGLTQSMTGWKIS